MKSWSLFIFPPKRLPSWCFFTHLEMSLVIKLLKLFTYLLVAPFIILFDYILFLGLEQLLFIV